MALAAGGRPADRRARVPRHSRGESRSSRRRRAGWATSCSRRRQPDEALDRFNGALKHAPAYAPALAGRAQALLALGRDAEALASLEAAAAADPSLDLGPRIEVLRFRRTEDRIGAARRAAEQGRLDEARAAYEQAIALSPESAFLLRELAAVEDRAGRPAKAVEHLQKAVIARPGRPEGAVDARRCPAGPERSGGGGEGVCGGAGDRPHT